MHVTFLSDQGNSLGLATYLSSEGHSVSLGLAINSTNLGKGIVNTYPINFNSITGDIVVIDNPLMGRIADELRKSGKRVIGANHWSEMVEKDTDYATKLMSVVGWEQKDLKLGVNLYISGWFNGAKFISSYCSLVYRRFMSGGHGPDLGCTGVVSNFKPVTDDIYHRILKPLEPVLRRVNHRGVIHLHTLVNAKDFMIKNISTDLGSPLSYVLFENSKSGRTETIIRVLDESSKPLVTIDQWAVAILVSVPPFPYGNTDQQFLLKGLHPAAVKHIWFIDAMCGNEGYSSAGCGGRLGYVLARGSESFRGANHEEAVSRAYRTISNLEVRDLQFRDDIGKGISNLLDTLKENSWLR